MRQLAGSDLDAYYEITSKDEVCKWLLSPASKTQTETKQLIEKFSNHWEDKGYGVWGVFDKQTNALLGHCGVQYLKDSGEVELLYAFGPKYWGHGYATEAARATLEWVFGKTKLNRIIVLAMPDNSKSINIIQKLGAKSSGIKEYFGAKLLCYEIIR